MGARSHAVAEHDAARGSSAGDRRLRPGRRRRRGAICDPPRRLLGGRIAVRQPHGPELHGWGDAPRLWRRCSPLVPLRRAPAGCRFAKGQGTVQERRVSLKASSSTRAEHRATCGLRGRGRCRARPSCTGPGTSSIRGRRRCCACPGRPHMPIPLPAGFVVPRAPRRRPKPRRSLYRDTRHTGHFVRAPDDASAAPGHDGPLARAPGISTSGTVGGRKFWPQGP
jgi:hypothetical protein